MSSRHWGFKIAVVMLLNAVGFHAHAEKGTDPFVQEFNQTDLGIAFTMLSKESWKNPGSQLFHTSPSTAQAKLQAVTLSNASRKIKPYQADTHYGLAFSMAEKLGFYQYFATKSQFTTSCGANNAIMVSPITKAPAKQYNTISSWAVSCGDNGSEQIAFCARCFDGGVCAGSGNTPNTPDGLWPALGNQVPFSQFQIAKNSIVAASGSKSTCKYATQDNIWNEFDTNGLSPKALVGVLVDGTTPPAPGSWVPSDSELCKYMTNASGLTKNWPVYTLTFTQSTATPSKLTKTRTLSCT